MGPTSPSCKMNCNTHALLERGHVFLPDILAPEEVKRYVRSEYARQSERKKRIILHDNLVSKDSAFLSLIDKDIVLELVTAVMGIYIRVISTEYWIRCPGSPGEPWHTDGSPAMDTVKGPHLIKVQFFLTPLKAKCNGNLLLSAYREKRKNFYAIRVTANPGDAIVWLGDLMHAVECNEGTNARHSIIIAYGYSWMSPYDFVDISANETSSMSPRKLLLMNGYLGKYRRGVFYRPADEEERKLLFGKLGRGF